MKKLIILLLGGLLLTACASKNISNREYDEVPGHGKGILRGVDIDINLNHITTGTSRISNMSSNLALEIGDAVLKEVFGEDRLSDTIFYVSENNNQDFYIVSRFIEDVVGGGYNVAISKEDGKILKIWADE